MSFLWEFAKTCLVILAVLLLLAMALVSVASPFGRRRP